MMAPYVSPIPSEEIEDYRKRDGTAATIRRVHRFPMANGSSVVCQPDRCRECWREANWPVGVPTYATEKDLK